MAFTGLFGRPLLYGRQLARLDLFGNLGERQSGKFRGRGIYHAPLFGAARGSAQLYAGHGPSMPSFGSTPGLLVRTSRRSFSKGPGQCQPPVCCAVKSQRA